MKKEINNIEEIENVIEEEVMETETKQKLGSKIVGFGKKHGKKIVKGVGGALAVGAVGLLGYVLGQKKSDGEDEYFDEDMDYEPDVSDFDEDAISE